MIQDIHCPDCGQSDQVAKVSTLYLLSIERRPKVGPQAVGQEPELHIDFISPPDMKRLGRRLAPPSTKSQSMRPVHPDWVLMAFTVIMPIFIIGIWNTQHSAILPVLAVLAVFYGVYFLRRRNLILRYQQEQDAQQLEKARVEKAIHTWMKLYYCARDEALFLPGRKDSVPVDQMDHFLSSKEI